ncbi:MAG TPA: hypothetical protein VK436_10395 [Methanocella sp.]|nr:hypothetical protein [Methanocella sp.]
MFLRPATEEKIARLISNAAQAPVPAIPAFLLINYFSTSFDRFLLITTISLLFASLLPVLVVELWSQMKGLDRDISRREERTAPLLIIIAVYLAGTAILYLVGAPLLAIILMFCYFSNTLVVLLITLFWKISIHSMGVSGPITALIFVFGVPGTLPMLILPFVMWSRVYLKKHTVAQVCVGALLGFVLTAAQFYLLSGL